MVTDKELPIVQALSQQEFEIINKIKEFQIWKN